jgi:hypothetical protein
MDDKEGTEAWQAPPGVTSLDVRIWGSSGVCGHWSELPNYRSARDDDLARGIDLHASLPIS